jgi:hypothetical protein
MTDLTEEAVMSRNALIIALLLAGCSAQPQDEFKNATPAQSAISINVPQSGSTEGASSSAILGQKASLYSFTRDVSRAVNGGVLSILALIEHITDQPPAARDDNKAVWGPITDGLNPATYLLVVSKTAPHQYDYVLSGKPKGADDSAYQAVLAGHADVVVDDVKGAGSFLVDFDAIHALDSSSKATGGIAVHYSNLGDPRNIEVAFANFDDGSASVPRDALYRYAEHPDHSGNFEFVTLQDIDGDGATKEVVAVLSRWNASGAGRSDADATGGSLGGLTVHLEECWDASFNETYYTDNLKITPTEGDPASCVF